MNKKTTQLLRIAILLCVFAIFPVFAETHGNNGLLYYSNLTPKNDIYEKVVMPGYTVALGRTYDLTHVSGVSKTYAWWSDWRIQGLTCTPTTIIKTSYIETNGMINPKNIKLDPEMGWKVGDWFQWDGCFEKPYQKGQTGPSYQPYLSDNNLVFTIIYDPNPPTPEPTPTPTPEPTTPEPTRTATPLPTTTPTPKIKDEGWPWWYYGIGIFLTLIGLRIIW